jgi:MoxR-like ATPase
MEPSTSVRPHLERPQFDASLSPVERLDLLRERRDTTQQSDLGVGYYVDRQGAASLVFSDLDGKSIVTIPTPLSRDSFDRIIERTLPLDETKFMLYELAKAYDQKTPIMFEGGTAIGKTFVVNLFAKLIYGEKAKIPDFYCNGQTDVSELLGKYVPAGVTQQDQAAIKRFIDSEAGQVLKAELLKETRGSYEIKELYTRAAAELNIPIDKKNFEFQLGVLPKAMTAGYDEKGNLQYVADGPGVMLHIQEVGMAAPSVVNALLQIRGEKGQLAESIQVWQDGGREVEAGPGFFVVFSTNPPGKGFQERFEVDKALARGLVWVNLPDKLSDESLRKAANKIFSFEHHKPSSGTVLDLSSIPELGAVLAGVMVKFHKAYVDKLENGEPGRKQKIPVTIDSLWKVAAQVQEVQVEGAIKMDAPPIDIVEGLRRAVKGIYVNLLHDKPDVVAARDMKSVDAERMGTQVMNMFEQCLSNDITNSIRFREEQVAPKIAIEQLVREAFDPSISASQSNLARNNIEEVESMKNLQAIEASLLAVKNLDPDNFTAALKQTLEALNPKMREELEKLIENWG